jgi:hypothetical protein
MWNCMLTDGLVGTEQSCMFRDGLVGTQRLEVTLDCASGLRSEHHELSFMDYTISIG